MNGQTWIIHWSSRVFKLERKNRGDFYRQCITSADLCKCTECDNMWALSQVGSSVGTSSLHPLQRSFIRNTHTRTRKQFRNGPMVTSFGFWAGLPDEDVCAHLAVGTRTSDWLAPSRDMPTHGCTTMIQRSFQSFCAVIHVGLYVALLWLILSAVCQRRARAQFAARLAKEFVHSLQEQQRGEQVITYRLA